MPKFRVPNIKLEFEYLHKSVHAVFVVTGASISCRSQQAYRIMIEVYQKSNPINHSI